MAYAGTKGLLSNSARTSMSMPFPTGLSNGDVALFYVGVNKEGLTLSPTPLVTTDGIPSGWRYAIIEAEYTGSETLSITWEKEKEPKSYSCEGVSVAASGRQLGSPVVGTVASGTSKTPTASSITVAAESDLFWFALEGIATLSTPPSGMTERLDGDGSEGSVFGMHVASQDAIGAGETGGKAGSWSTSTAWRAVLIALPPANKAVHRRLSLLGAGR